jgi:hypothetical protein
MVALLLLTKRRSWLSDPGEGELAIRRRGRSHFNTLPRVSNKGNRVEQPPGSLARFSLRAIGSDPCGLSPKE